MGNQNSTNKQQNTNELKPKTVSETLDYIATHYIITMDFKSLKKLYQREYCDKLVILTSDIIKRYFTDLEITYLAQRVKNGVEVNEEEKDNVIFFNKDNLDHLDVQNSVKKNRICISIAKFYVKIAHLFAAIVTTINPTYVYKDAEGATVRASLYEKSKIPPNTPRQILKLNICDNRINSLKNNQEIMPDEKGDITISPNICGINIRDDGINKSLEDEPGIPELMELYYDDKYDVKTGKFTSMTKNTQLLFFKNLKSFYQVFTGEQDVPEYIVKFNDIKLRDYHKMPQCQGNDPIFEKTVKGPLEDTLFTNYANNLKKMIVSANMNQQSLLSIINQIFLYTIDPQTNKKRIRISPELTENKLQQLIEECRGIIIKLYLTCEEDYVRGIKLYEAIVEKKIYDTTINQVRYFEKEKTKLIIPDDVPEPAELQELNKTEEQGLSKEK